MPLLNEVVFGQVSSPNDLNSVIDILSRRAGQVETGHYGIAGNWAGTGSGFTGGYMPTLSRGTTPVSVTIDTADQAPSTGAVAPSTANLTNAGFKYYTSSTNSNNVFCAGNYTVQN